MVLAHRPLEPPPHLLDQAQGRVAIYKSQVEYIDTLMGRTLSALEDQGLRNDTLFVFTADNGGASFHERTWNNITLIGGKSRPYDAGTRVPFIVSWPGVIDARATPTLCDQSDVLPTLRDAFNYKARHSAVDPHTRDGYSLWPELLSKKTAALRDATYIALRRGAWAVRDAQHTLILYSKKGRVEKTYNMKSLYQKKTCRRKCRKRQSRRRSIRPILRFALKHWLDKVQPPKNQGRISKCKEIEWDGDRLECVADVGTG
eukprot:m.25380 g.25380  ORF g.25380 m.25380 type:complete len:259 (-) comp11590_c0_seq1:77-853(-)